MSPSAQSINNISIRLTDERWRHIVENRDELAGYFYSVLEVIETPDIVLAGNTDECWAVKLMSGKKKALVVIYKEDQNKMDGFIITAFFTSKVKKLLKRNIIWEKQH